MRVNLIAQISTLPGNGVKSAPVSLTVRPTCGVAGDYQYATDSAAVLRLLRRHTDLSADVITRFEGEMYSYPSARLSRVELSENVLTEIGYFVE